MAIYAQKPYIKIRSVLLFLSHSHTTHCSQARYVLRQ